MLNVQHVRKAAVWPIVEKAFPNYSGDKFRVIPAHAVTFTSTLYQKGSVSTYKIVLLDRGKSLPLPASMERIVEGETLPLTKGMALVEHQIFQGHDLGIRVWVHPSLAEQVMEVPAAAAA